MLSEVSFLEGIILCVRNLNSYSVISAIENRTLRLRSGTELKIENLLCVSLFDFNEMFILKGPVVKNLLKPVKDKIPDGEFFLFL